MFNIFKSAPSAVVTGFGFTAVTRMAAVFCLICFSAEASYIVLEDMRAGLDARKSVVSAPAGTLREALNGHITPGGEFEKRKAFVQTSLPIGTYGLEAITNGLVTFGSDADPGGWPRGNVVSYQRLQHPAVLEGLAYNATYHNLTGIVWSVCHEGLPFAAAVFSDGREFLYYNGNVITNSMAGIVFEGMTNNTYVAKQFAGYAYDAQPDGWYTYYFGAGSDLNFVDGATVFLWKPATTYSVVQNINSTSGKFSFDDAYGAISEIFQYGLTTFAVTNTAATGTDYYIYARPNGVTGPWSLVLAGGAPYPSTNLAASINMRSNYSGFTAFASNTVVYVYAPIYQPSQAFFSTNYIYPSLSNYCATDPGFSGTKSFSTSIIGKPAPDAIEPQFWFWDSWTAGDTWSVNVVGSDGNTFTIGKGNISGRQSISGFSHKGRVYLSLSNEFGFSSITDPTKFEDQDTGAGLVTFSSTLGSLDTVQGIGEYQGGIAVAGKLTTQLWNTDPDPADFYLRQTIPIGTVSGQTIQSLGKLDTLMLADSGVRSLRVRDSSGNAIVEDVGTPIDGYLQTALSGLTETQKRAACSVVDPASGRYWVYVPGDYIYVFSFHPLSQISAWTRYAPTYNDTNSIRVSGSLGGFLDGTYTYNLAGALTNAAESFYITNIAGLYWMIGTGSFVSLTNRTLEGHYSGQNSGGISYASSNTATANVFFSPQKFTVFDSQIFVRSTNAVYAYGGSGNTNYDACNMVAETPFLNGNTPGTYKSYNGLDLIDEGIWTAKLCANIASDNSYVTVINAATNSTVTAGRPGLAARATHFKLRLEESGTGYARMSSVLLYYTPGESR